MIHVSQPIVKTALTFYPQGGETTVWEYLPTVPRPGDTIHYSLTDDPDDSMAWNVHHVSWAKEGGQWYVEVSCG